MNNKTKGCGEEFLFRLVHGTKKMKCGKKYQKKVRLCSKCKQDHSQQDLKNQTLGHGGEADTDSSKSMPGTGTNTSSRSRGNASRTEDTPEETSSKQSVLSKSSGFNLSKRKLLRTYLKAFIPDDVEIENIIIVVQREDKEFIRLLKDGYKFKIVKIKGIKYITVKDYVGFVDYMDKISGDELIK